MRKCLAAAILALAAVLATGCAGAPFPKPTPTPTPAPSEEKVNFRFLISDDVNAIEDFEHLYVTISSIGVQEGGESGKWHVLDPLNDPDGDGAPGIDLRPLEGENALSIWSGNITAGKYTKAFIYVSKVEGILKTGETANVKLPSEKLQISKPFEVTDDSVANFVYDIMVVEAGKSGKYILKPQIAQSGADQKFKEVTPKGKPEEGKKGKPGEGEKGKPEKPPGKSEKPGKSEDELNLRLEGEPKLGMEATLIVTDRGSPVEGAVVTINGEEVEAETNHDGRLTILLPDTPGEVKIEATLGDKEGELELELGEEGQSEWFEGTITEINEGEENASPWTMTLEGIEGQVTVYVAELEGTPSVSAKAEVKGILTNNTIEDAEAEIKEE